MATTLPTKFFVSVTRKEVENNLFGNYTHQVFIQNVNPLSSVIFNLLKIFIDDIDPTDIAQGHG